MFWKKILIRMFWGMIFLVILLLAMPVGNEIKLHDTIIKSDNIFDIYKFLPKENLVKSINPMINTGILTEIQNNYEMHGAAENRQSKYDNICNNWTSLCEKISYSNVSDKDKYFYQGIISLVISKLTNFGNLAVIDTLQNIQIDGSNGDRRGYAGRTKIYMHPKDINSYREFMDVFSHELGHVVDLGVLQGTDQNPLDQTYTEFSRAVFYTDDPSINFYKISWSNENTTYKITSYKDFVSGYGMSNPFEDFAECHNMYINHQDAFAKMAENNTQLKSKYEYLQKLYQSNYLQNDTKNLTKISKNIARRPRDTTRIR